MAYELVKCPNCPSSFLRGTQCPSCQPSVRPAPGSDKPVFVPPIAALTRDRVLWDNFPRTYAVQPKKK